MSESLDNAETNNVYSSSFQKLYPELSREVLREPIADASGSDPLTINGEVDNTGQSDLSSNLQPSAPSGVEVFSADNNDTSNSNAQTADISSTEQGFTNLVPFQNDTEGKKACEQKSDVENQQKISSEAEQINELSNEPNNKTVDGINDESVQASANATVTEIITDNQQSITNNGVVVQPVSDLSQGQNSDIDSKMTNMPQNQDDNEIDDGHQVTSTSNVEEISKFGYITSASQQQFEELEGENLTPDQNQNGGSAKEASAGVVCVNTLYPNLGEPSNEQFRRTDSHFEGPILPGQLVDNDDPRTGGTLQGDDESLGPPPPIFVDDMRPRAARPGDSALQPPEYSYSQ